MAVKIAVVMPVWLQEIAMMEMTCKSLDTIGYRCGTLETDIVGVYVVTSRLKTSMISPECLESVIRMHVGSVAKLLYTPNRERSVAACWNEGIKQALTAGADFILVYANDVSLSPTTIDELVRFGVANPDIDLWSAINAHNRLSMPKGDSNTSADFCCFMIRPETYAKHGTFDERFRPAYFEDNDYYGRIILGGGHCAQVHSARVIHLGSMTVKSDSEAAHHCNHWFPVNKHRMLSKWQTHAIANTPEEVLAMYSRHPWGDEKLPLTFWDRG